MPGRIRDVHRSAGLRQAGRAQARRLAAAGRGARGIARTDRTGGRAGPQGAHGRRQRLDPRQVGRVRLGAQVRADRGHQPLRQQGSGHQRAALRRGRRERDLSLARRSARRGGFKPEDVTLLTDSTAQKPTNTNIGRALNQLITATHEGDLVLVYFSGHGYEEEGRAYLLPANADLTALDYSAIERDAFVRQIDKIPARKVVVVLDACHSGGVNRGGKGVGKDAALSNRYYDSFASSQGRAFIASSSGGELSWEDEDSRHGVFTQSLVQALSGAADIQPADGLVTLHEVQQYLEGSVSDWAGRRGKSQHPQVNLESARGDMPLAINQAFLEEQSQELAARHDLATHVRDGLSKADGLSLTELSQSLAVVDRFGRGDAMNDADTTVFAYAQRLSDGAITADEYRTGIARSIRMTTAAQMGLGARKSSKKKLIFGGIGLAVLGGVAASAGGGGGDSGPATPVLIGPPPPPPAPAPAP
ncbi:MAG: caspase family protein [Candidatus Eisenbacteria bacterium]|nr:caspase family protein [Candidatus Eisenbacteria bacterium]